MDDMDMGEPIHLSEAPRNAETGAFILVPGVYYKGDLESYCLKAGAWAPWEGKGVLSARMKGPRAAIIQKLMARQYQHLEVSQQSVQSLLWAIMAGARIQNIKGSARSAALALLKPHEILELNGGVNGVLGEIAMKEALERAPASLKKTMKAENEIRKKLAQGQNSYEELESIAMATGVMPPDPNDRNIPRTRWTEHPAGFLVRVQTMGYARATHHVYLPLQWSTTFDDLGRITRVEHDGGAVYQVEYDDKVLPRPMAGKSGWAQYRVRSVTVSGPERPHSLERRTETFAEVPDMVAPYRDPLGLLRKDVETRPSPHLVKAAQRSSSNRSAMDKKEAIQHFNDALNAVGDRKEESKWLGDHMKNLITWYRGAGDAISGRNSQGATEYDATRSITLPAEVIRQRGGHSNVLKRGPQPDRATTWDYFR